MTSIASQATLDELDAQAHRAWADYRESLRDLRGAEYEAAESDSWERLQDELRDVDARRARSTPIAG